VLWSAARAVCTLVRRSDPTIFEVHIDLAEHPAEVAMFVTDADAAKYAIKRRIDICGC